MANDGAAVSSFSRASSDGRIDLAVRQYIDERTCIIEKNKRKKAVAVANVVRWFFMNHMLQTRHGFPRTRLFFEPFSCHPSLVLLLHWRTQGQGSHF
jgi:hypothetical protein